MLLLDRLLLLLLRNLLRLLLDLLLLLLRGDPPPLLYTYAPALWASGGLGLVYIQVFMFSLTRSPFTLFSFRLFKFSSFEFRSPISGFDFLRLFFMKHET